MSPSEATIYKAQSDKMFEFFFSEAAAYEPYSESTFEISASKATGYEAYSESTFEISASEAAAYEASCQCDECMLKKNADEIQDWTRDVLNMLPYEQELPEVWLG
ncbi:hypothetical protein AK812_SmicGene28178 [Symbiodinium microadriaticum]|uniref:Uncharacterized protein n=1 Tax=Symbiodinium microadriaticum TaxID=2951 RepID=A0A1Q9D568_SYMMI|nr:hypothetical protein AK812_SmicGene28178 [Symbiodinium microadriaticum]